MKNVLVTGGAGYVGGRLIPKLLECGFNVTVLDLFIFEPNLFSNIENDNLKLVRGDLRNYELVDNTLSDIDTVIHLGCLSNDPSCDLDEDLTKSINLDAGIQLIDLAIANNVSRFINASSASVYGIQSRDNVTEDSQLSPITLYAQYKVELEKYLHQKATDNFCPVTLRPATVCGYSPRLRLDLTVNILTSHAYFDKKITVFGGQQKRPNIHINDLIDIYLLLITAPKSKVYNEVFNAGFSNKKVIDIAHLILQTLPLKGINLEVTETNDFRSYHISSEKLLNTFDYTPKHTIEDAITDLYYAFKDNHLLNYSDLKYRNVSFLQQYNL